MVSRWLWWAPLGIFVLFWAVLGLRYGMMAVQTTESDVITRYAHRYLSDHGADARLSDCVAVPASDRRSVWIVVSCDPRGTFGRYEYHINRIGGLEHAVTPAPATMSEPRA